MWGYKNWSNCDSPENSVSDINMVEKNDENLAKFVDAAFFLPPHEESPQFDFDVFTNAVLSKFKDELEQIEACKCV